MANETIKKQAEAPRIPTAEAFLAQFEAAPLAATSSIRFKKEFDRSPWQIMYFSPERLVQQSAQIAQMGWVVVHKDGGIHGYLFSDWFEPDMFDETSGRIERHIWNRERNQKEIDDVLCVRPMAAQEAEDLLRKKYWDKLIGKKNNIYTDRAKGAVAEIEDDAEP